MEWVHFINVGDVQYLANRDGRDLEQSDLGPVVATVLCERSEALLDPSQAPRDGDAAFLPVGTEIRSLRAYDPSFRLAAPHEGRIELFEAASNPGARVGRDLLDLANKVDRLSIDRPRDGSAEVAIISSTRDLMALVQMVLNAPVDQSRGRPAGEPYLLTFHLTDGTVVRRSYWADSGELMGGILLPDAFRIAIMDALDQRS